MIGQPDIMQRALDLLQKIYGHQAFRGQQAAIIGHVAQGGDALVLMPTGGGKSVCYQIPALLRDGVGIVVSPLIALMQDQVAALQQMGVAAAFLNSSQTLDELREIERQLRLLRYFGEIAGPCGNCDICLDPGETWDATIAAQKLLSAAWRTGQRFGVTHLIDVLRGEATEKVTQYGHDRLSTFGIGRDLSVADWKSLARQLVSLGYFTVDGDGFNTLAVSEAARPLLKGEQRLSLRKATIKLKGGKAGRRSSAIQLGPGGVDPRLWEALRVRRRDLAAAQNVPPYVIFHDNTLIEIAQRKPQTLDEFLAIPGIGERKLARYGDDFLEVLADFA